MVVVGCMIIDIKLQGITFLMKRSPEAHKVEISNFFLEPLRSKKGEFYLWHRGTKMPKKGNKMTITTLFKFKNKPPAKTSTQS